MTTVNQLAPLHEAPVSVHPPYDQRHPIEREFGEPATDWYDRVQDERVAALLEPLAGVELGHYDRRILDWLAGWDVETVGTVASLLHRARQAGGTP